MTGIILVDNKSGTNETPAKANVAQDHERTGEQGELSTKLEATVTKAAKEWDWKHPDTSLPVAEQVWRQLLEDFPPEAIGWVKRAKWTGPEQVPRARRPAGPGPTRPALPVPFASGSRWCLALGCGVPGDGDAGNNP